MPSKKKTKSTNTPEMSERTQGNATHRPGTQHVFTLGKRVVSVTVAELLAANDCDNTEVFRTKKGAIIVCEDAKGSTPGYALMKDIKAARAYFVDSLTYQSSQEMFLLLGGNLADVIEEI